MAEARRIDSDQRLDDMAAKVRTYFGGGTRVVWIVWPDRHQVDVWHAVDRQQPVATLGIGDTLDGEDGIPSFTRPVANVFADLLEFPDDDDRFYDST